jgi:hypothetical protein
MHTSEKYGEKENDTLEKCREEEDDPVEEIAKI